MSLKVIHFQSIFLIYFYLKRLIYVQIYGITNQIVMQQVIQEKEEFLQKNSLITSGLTPFSLTVLAILRNLPRCSFGSSMG